MAFSLWYYCWCHYHISYHTLCWFVCFVKTRKSAGRQPDVVMAIIVLPVSPRRSLTSPSVFGRDSRVSRSVETPLFVGHKSLFRIQSRLRHSDLQPQHTYAEFWRKKAVHHRNHFHHEPPLHTIVIHHYLIFCLFACLSISSNRLQLSWSIPVCTKLRTAERNLQTYVFLRQIISLRSAKLLTSKAPNLVAADVVRSSQNRWRYSTAFRLTTLDHYREHRRKISLCVVYSKPNCCHVA